MMDRYIVECMVSIININNGIKEPTCEYQSCNASQVFHNGWVSKGESIFVNLSYYLGQDLFYVGLKVLAWYIDPNDIGSKNIHKCPVHPTGIKNMRYFVITDT